MDIKQITEKPLYNAIAFGIALQKCRQERDISLSRLSIRGEIVVSNLRSIERGLVQPSISVAMRLLTAMNIDIPTFFKEFAITNKLLSYNIECPEREILSQSQKLIDSINKDEIKLARSPFGMLFHEYRGIHGVTQKFVSEYASYGLRNILDVEKGNQDPNTLNALAMVCAVAEKSQTGIGVFFNAYQQILQEISKD